MSSWDKAVILPVDPVDLDYYWPFVSEYISSALEHTDGEISLQDIHSAIANHNRQLWVIKDQSQYIAAVVTQIYSYDGSGVKIGEVTLAGGRDHARWDHFTDLVGEWFQEQGCKFIDIIGRPGWQRIYKDRGFRTAYVQLRKELKDVD